MVYNFPVIRGILPPAGGEILHAFTLRIFHQHIVLPRFPCIQPPVYPLPDIIRFGDVPGALECHRLEDDESLPVLAVLPDSCEVCSQRVDKVTPNSPAQRVRPPRGHDCQGFPAGLTHLVVLDPPTEVRSIVGLHPVSIKLFDPPFFTRGNVPGQIPCGPLYVPRLILLFLCRHRRLRVCSL